MALTVSVAVSVSVAIAGACTLATEEVAVVAVVVLSVAGVGAVDVVVMMATAGAVGRRGTISSSIIISGSDSPSVSDIDGGSDGGEGWCRCDAGALA